jgi:Leucine-rich repeat (LRR) protein
VQKLVLGHLPAMVDLQAFANIRVTRELSVESMPDLVSFAGSHVGPDLDALSAWYVPRLESLADLDGLQQLGSLSLKDAPALARLSLPDDFTELYRADFSGLDQMTTLGELSRFTMLDALSVSSSPRLADLGGSDAATGSLRTLIVGGCPSLTVLDPVGGLSNLVELSLADCDGITEIDGLAASVALDRLEISRNDALARLPVFERAGPSMRAVRIVANASLTEAPQFPNLVTLYQFDSFNYGSAELMIEDNPQLRSIGSFPRLESSTMVTISGNPLIESVSLPSLQALEWLRVSNSASLESLELDVQSNLVIVELDNNPMLSDVALGAPAQELRRLTLRDNPLLAREVRELLLGLVTSDTEVTLD